MKLFELIRESRVVGVKAPQYFEILEDPTPSELRRLFREAGYDELRAILTSQHAYFWDADKGLHKQVAQNLIDNKTIPAEDKMAYLGVFGNRNQPDLSSILTQYRNHPWVDMLHQKFPNHPWVAGTTVSEDLVESPEGRNEPVLFHRTGPDQALSILQDGMLRLKGAVGVDSETDKAINGHTYYFSTSRSPIGNYNLSLGQGVVQLELNRDWFKQHYVIKPIDYWDGMWKSSVGTNNRTYREMEDRIYSKTPEIVLPEPITKAIRAIHMYVNFENRTKWKDPDSDLTFGRWIRKLLIAAKQRRIPIYVYTDKNAYRNLDTRKAVSLSDKIAQFALKEPQSFGSQFKKRDYLAPYRELALARHMDPTRLSEDGKYLLKKLKQTWYLRDHLASLSSELHNARTYDQQSYNKTVALMKQLGKTKLPDFIEWLVQRWESTAESLITEDAFRSTRVPGATVEVIKNPTRKIFNELDTHGGVRGFIFPNGDVCIWDAALALHPEVSEEIGSPETQSLSFVTHTTPVKLIVQYHAERYGEFNRLGFKSEQDVEDWLRKQPKLMRILPPGTDIRVTSSDFWQRASRRRVELSPAP